MSWWQRELETLIVMAVALAMGAAVWAISQWISDDTWADVVGAASAVVITFWLLNRYLRARQREDFRRGPPH
jgi:membrane protein implicated in regulation of membrane protease activity